METTYNYTGQEDLLVDSLETPAYAGFWLRVAAALIDSIVLYAVQMILYLVAGVSMLGGLELFKSPVYYVALVIGIFYVVVLESSKWQATLGKMAVGIVVTDLDGNRISFARALGRYFAKFISMIPLFIGFAMAGFTEKKQCLHDMICGTLVVKK